MNNETKNKMWLGPGRGLGPAFFFFFFLGGGGGGYMPGDIGASPAGQYVEYLVAYY